MDNISEFEQSKVNCKDHSDNKPNTKCMFNDLVDEILDFRDERSWKQFHNAKDLAISICLEAAELLEIFQWSGDDVDVTDKKSMMFEELADIIIYCIYLADVLDADIGKIIRDKINVNEKKYNKMLFHGNANKYNTMESTNDNLPK